MDLILKESRSQIQKFEGILEMIEGDFKNMVLYLSRPNYKNEVRPIIFRGERDLVYSINCESKQIDLVNFAESETKYVQ